MEKRYYGIKAIPTIFKGIKYDSLNEARWAVFFDALNIPFEPQPRGDMMETPNGTTYYQPDFRIKLPHKGCNYTTDSYFVEIKHSAPVEEEVYKAQQLAILSRYPVFILTEQPYDNLYASSDKGWKFDIYGDSDTGHVFTECCKCGSINLVYGGYTNELPCPHDTGRGNASYKITAAAITARGFNGRDI